MPTLKTMGDVLDQGTIDGYQYLANGGSQANYKPTMHSIGDEVCGLNLNAQGYYEAGFELGMIRWVESWDSALADH